MHKKFLAIVFGLFVIFGLSPSFVSATPCVTHSPPSLCTGTNLCAAAKCWNITSTSPNWANCQRYDYDGDCDIDVADIMTCSSKCQLDGQEGSCCSFEYTCGTDLECQTCYENQGINMGECTAPPASLNPINWQTNYVSLKADDFYLIANGQKYLANIPNIALNSSPASNTYTTLEASWQENGKEMRFYIYLKSDGQFWWSNEIRTYNGQQSPDWIYYTNQDGFFKTNFGSSFTSQTLELLSDSGNGRIYFKNLRLEPHFFSGTPTPSLPPLSPLGEQKTLVIMFNFQDNPNNKPFTKEEVYSAVFTGSNSLNSYYKEVSFNQTWFSGEVAGWYTIPWNTGCSWNTEEINNMVKVDGFNVDSCQRLIYLHPYLPSQCSGSSGSTDGNPSDAWIDQTLYLGTWAHEAGHNLTLGHANSRITAYGDPFSPQGTGTNHQHAFFKAALGWIPPERVQEVSRDGIYTIYPLERPETRIQALKIRKTDTNEYYYLEYRRPIGFDANLPKKITEGALIHIGFYMPAYTLNQTVQSHESYLIDTTPNTPPYDDAALADGTSFYDEINGITIKQLSHDENSVTVSVTFSPTCPTGAIEKGDLNCDSLINEIDLTIFLSRSGEAGLPSIQTLLDNWQI